MAERLTEYTTDHDAIRRWAESRGGRPAAVVGAKRSRGDPGMIRIDFPGYSGAGSLREISWDEWFEKFDSNNLALAFQETTAAGQISNFNKIVSAETVEGAGAGRGANRGQGGRSRAGRSEGRANRSGGRSSSGGRGARGGRAGRRSSSGSQSRGRGSGERSSAKRSPMR